jgi:hypothetical protein
MARKPKKSEQVHPDATLLWGAARIAESLMKEYSLLTASPEKELLYLTAENLLVCTKYAAASMARKDISTTTNNE